MKSLIINSNSMDSSFASLVLFMFSRGGGGILSVQLDPNLTTDNCVVDQKITSNQLQWSSAVR